MLAKKLSIYYKNSMIDLSYFRQLSNNKISFLIRVMGVFINETPNDLEELETNYQEKNYKKVKEICHKLKGLFKSYNMKELTELTIELEDNAKIESFSDHTTELLSLILKGYAELRIEMIELSKQYREKK